jgi:hypothetical protein
MLKVEEAGATEGQKYFIFIKPGRCKVPCFLLAQRSNDYNSVGAKQGKGGLASLK